MEPSFERFAARIQAANKEILRIQSKEMEEYDLKPNAYFILHYLADAPHGMTSAELARSMSVSRAVISRSLHALVEQNLVKLSAPHMEYGTNVALTEQGQATVLDLRARAQRYARAAIVNVAEHERTQMYEALDGIITNLKGI